MSTDEKQEWHYAPMTGTLYKKVSGKFVHINNFEEQHANMTEFLDLREKEEITLTETINYGHPIFSGHSGRVDIYS